MINLFSGLRGQIIRHANLIHNSRAHGTYICQHRQRIKKICKSEGITRKQYVARAKKNRRENIK